jgi:hypothetical protein
MAKTKNTPDPDVTPPSPETVPNTDDPTRAATEGEHVWYRVSSQDAANYSLLGSSVNDQVPAEITYVHTDDTVNLLVTFLNGTQAFTARPRGGGQGEWDRRQGVASGAADVGGARNTPDRLSSEVSQRAANGEQVRYDEQTVDAPHEDAQGPEGAPLTADTNTEADRLTRAHDAIVGTPTEWDPVTGEQIAKPGEQRYDDRS